MAYHPRTKEAALKITTAFEKGVPPAQDWDDVHSLSMEPRGISTPLGQALVYDMAVQHGLRHDMIGSAERALGVPFKSKVIENGVSEQQMISKLAAVREERHPDDPRADFWVSLMIAGDWQLAGLDGTVTVNGQPVAVGVAPSTAETTYPGGAVGREAEIVIAGTGLPKATTVVEVTESQAPAEDSDERVKQAAFNITGAFEGGGYATYQNWDSGIVSYGIHQFTLASGSLFTVLEKYIALAAGMGVANQLKDYLERTRVRDAALRNDTTYRDLLVRAAGEPAMQQAQDDVTTIKYWDRVHNVSIIPRGIKTPLGRALVFDMGVNHGIMHDMLGLAEEQIGVEPRSKLIENGATEEQLITQLALVRQDRMNRLAEKLNAPGLIPRGDFWVKMTGAGDWHLQGDENGQVEAKRGRKVQVRNP